jgi:hypothetical protein
LISTTLPTRASAERGARVFQHRPSALGEHLNVPVAARSSYIDRFYQQPCSGIVFALFRNGLDVRFGDDLLFIGSQSTPLSAFGFALDAPSLQQVLSTLKPGMEVNRESGKLKVIVSEDRRLTIDAACCEAYDLSFDSFPEDGVHVADRARVLMEFLEPLNYGLLCGFTFSQQEHQYFDALACPDDERAFEAINFFCGRGFGLTPAGDDLLWGFALAHLLFNSGHPWLDSWRAYDFGQRTTLVSCAYKKTLERGYVSEDWKSFIQSAVVGDGEALKRGLSLIQKCGHSSGNDAVFGLYLGITSLNLV